MRIKPRFYDLSYRLLYDPVQYSRDSKRTDASTRLFNLNSQNRFWVVTSFKNGSAYLLPTFTELVGKILYGNPVNTWSTLVGLHLLPRRRNVFSCYDTLK
jgi:hypothetical protein